MELDEGLDLIALPARDYDLRLPTGDCKGGVGSGANRIPL